MNFKVIVQGKSCRNFEDPLVAISYVRSIVPCVFEEDEAKRSIAARKDFNLSYGDDRVSLRVIE